MENFFRRMLVYISALCILSLLPIPLFSAKAHAAPLFQEPQPPDFPEEQLPDLFYNELQIVYLTNLKRREQGLAPLRWNRELSKAARWFAKDSVDTQPNPYCGHTDTEKGSPGDRILAHHYTNAMSWGENVVCGLAAPEAAVTGWMNNEGHKQNILQAMYREIGVGYYRNLQTGKGYIVQDFSYDPNYAPVIINNEAPNTTAPEVQLYLYNPALQSGLEGMSDAAEMMIANDASFTAAVWEPFAQEKAWTLETGEGWRTVYVKTRDAQGRTTLVSDSIYLGATIPEGTLSLEQASIVKQELEFYNLDQSGWPSVQLSVNWQGDNSDVLFEHIAGEGEEVRDELAVGGTVLKLGGTKASHARYWTTEFYKDVPFTAYVRVKIDNNSSADEVLRLKINGGGTEYGPLSIKGTDFVQVGEYQEFSLPFTFHASSAQPFLIFNLYSAGNTPVFIDNITVYTTAMPSENLVAWPVVGGYYRSRGIWGRFINNEGKFSNATELIPNAASISPLPPELPTEKQPPSTIVPTPILNQVLLPIVMK